MCIFNASFGDMIKKISILLVFLCWGWFAGAQINQYKVDSIHQLLDTLNDQWLIMDAYEELVYLYDDNYDSAYNYSRKYLKNALKYDDTLYIANAYYLVANTYYYSDNDSTLFYTDKYLETALLTEDSLWIQDAYNLMAYVHSKEGNVPTALNYYQKTLQISEALNDSFFIASCFINIGYTLSYTREQSKALQYFLKGLEIAEELGDTSAQSDAHYNIAYYYQETKSYETAMDHYEKSLALSKSSSFSDSIAIALTYAEIAGISLKQNNISDFELFMDSSNLLIPLNYEDYDLANLYSIYVDHYLESKQNTLAKFYIDEIDKITSSKSFNTLQAFTYQQKGKLFYIENDFLNSIEQYQRSIDMFNAENSVEPMAELYADMAKSYSALNQSKKAYQWLLKSNQYEDSLNLGTVKGVLSEFEQKSLFNAEMQKKELILELEKQRLENNNLVYKNRFRATFTALFLIVVVMIMLFYFFQLIRKQNQKLNQQNDLIKNQLEKLEENEKKLAELNATKDKFFSIIAHDLKNPLSSIINLSGLFIDDISNIDQERLRKYIASMNKTARHGFSLLENLLEWARTQTGNITPQIKNIMMEEVINNTIEGLRESAYEKQITIEFKNSIAGLVLADENMIKTVLRNLLHNAIKFSYPGGIISIVVFQENEKIKTCINDKGIGLDADEIKNIFKLDKPVRKFGTNKEIGTGLGLLVCKEFIEMNKGTITVKGEKDRGCSFCIELPSFNGQID